MHLTARRKGRPPGTEAKKRKGRNEYHSRKGQKNVSAAVAQLEKKSGL